MTETAAVAMNAGVDVDCGSTYFQQLPAALNQSLVQVSQIQQYLTHLYASLVRLGYFDQPYRQLGWADVNTPQAQQLAYQSAVEGMVLLKNDGTLPLKASIKELAIVEPWANATTQMQGNHQGIASFLISPIQAAVSAGFDVSFQAGTTMISGNDTSGFAAAVAAAQEADVVIYAGGIDDSVEAEGDDRTAITGSQLDLIAQLAAV